MREKTAGVLGSETISLSVVLDENFLFLEEWLNSAFNPDFLVFSSNFIYLDR